MLNPFASADAYDTGTLTAGINEFGIRYGRINQLMLAGTPVRSSTRQVFLERVLDELVLLMTKPPEAAPNQGNPRTRDVRGYKTTHIPLEDVVLPQEVANRRPFGAEVGLETMEAILAEHADDNAARFDITSEFQQLGMIQGIVRDGDGSTLFDWFDEWGIAQQTEDFAFTTDTTDVHGALMSAKRKIQKGLRGDVLTGYMILASPTWFTAFMAHPDVKERLKYTNPGAGILQSDVRGGVDFAGVRVEEYFGEATKPDGTTLQFIADDEAHLFPLGTRNTFRTIYSPMESNEWVNTPGQRLYNKLEQRKYGKGWDLWYESNPLHVLLKPNATVKLTLS